ncbi:MAG: DUF262 domain-containing protein [Deltaproteobacteria bacterium]|nr:DUF262 domain-containing protein [Deltaproteobacteria bacterium]
MKIQTILDHIDSGHIALPEFQRGYVWNRDQVKGLMHSLYKRHPVGSLLVWVTKADTAPARGDGELAPGVVKLLLDGQQRITSLYGIIRNKTPKFFQGDARSFNGLYFNLDEEIFEFYAPMKMQDNPLWISISEIMQTGAGEEIKKIVTIPELQANLTEYINKLANIDSIKTVDLHVDEVTGEDKTVDVVVDIFNRVNSGGTKLSKGDLALAKVCASWPEARDEMLKRLKKWENAGFHFKLEWLLRCINTIVTGEALFSALENVSTPMFKNGLEQAEKYINKLLNLISARLGLDHDRVLGSRYSFPLLVHYLHKVDGSFGDYIERDKLLFWYIHTFLWGRYAGSTESVLNQDLAVIEETEGALDRLVNQLRQNRGNLKLTPDDFMGWSRSARFYPLLYMLSRVGRAKDWEDGIELREWLLGKTASLQVHHIFPKSILYEHGYSKAEVNAIANFTFLTQETNLKVSNKNPLEYLEEYSQKHLGAVESHWIPMDRNLWKTDNYLDFLEARRELLAKAANEFLESLHSGEVPEMEEIPSVLERERIDIPGGFAGEEEERIVNELNDWIVQQGLPKGEILYELADQETGEPLAVLDLAWPDGLQEGYSQPVALMIDEEKETQELVSSMGYRYFTNSDSFRSYVLKNILAAEELAA